MTDSSLNRKATALSEPNNPLNPHMVPSGTLLLHNTNHKNYLKTILLLTHLCDELNSAAFYWLTVPQQVERIRIHSCASATLHKAVAKGNLFMDFSPHRKGI